MFEARHIQFHYAKRTALSDVGFRLSPGEIIGILGRNGSGKSTLFGLLSGAQVWQKGEAFYEGKSIVEEGLRVQPWFRRWVGTLFQGNSLDKKLSGERNLLYAAHIFGVSRERAKVRVAEILESADLRDRSHEPVEKLSFGMQRRLEIYRSFLHEPRLLILDEATAGLDEDHAASFFAFLKQYCQETNAIVLMSTHDCEETALCDRILVIDEGRVLKEATPQSLRNLVRGHQIEIRMHAWATACTKSELRQKIAQVSGTLAEDYGLHSLRLSVPDASSISMSLAEILKSSAIRSVNIQNPTLADAYLLITGKTFKPDRKEAQKEA